MDPQDLKALLEHVREGSVSPDEAAERLAKLPYEDLGFAKIDHHRALRQGMPEVVFGESKQVEQIAGIARELIRAQHNVLITRLSADQASELLQRVPELEYQRRARVATFEHHPVPLRAGAAVPVITAGTSDIPVAEEALAVLYRPPATVANPSVPGSASSLPASLSCPPPTTP